MFESDWCFSCEKATTKLGWKMTPFSEAIAATWADYQALAQASVA